MKKLMFLTLLLSLLAWSGCRPCDDPTNPECPNYCVDETNPECPNYDPCWDAMPPVSAAFEMVEVIGRFQESQLYYIPTDTVLTNNVVRFRAKQQADSYQWRIGTDLRTFNEREFTLFFPDPDQLTVTLIVQRTPQVNCYPEDDGMDTISKRLVVVPVEKSMIVGDYKGSTDQRPEEVYTLSFYKKMYYYDTTQFSHISLTNVHPGCDNTVRDLDVMRGDPAYRGFRYYDSGGIDRPTQCFATSIIAELNEAGDSILVRFQRTSAIRPYPPLEGEFIFRGARVR